MVGYVIGIAFNDYPAVVGATELLILDEDVVTCCENIFNCSIIFDDVVVLRHGKLVYGDLDENSYIKY